MPPEFQLTPEALVLPDGTKIALGFMQADDRFAEIFHTSCRRPPTDNEQAAIDAYTVNALLCGPGGSPAAARAMMQAGAAGVFIDNCALAFGGQNWLELAEDGGPDAPTFAFVSIVGGRTDVYKKGMHALGRATF